ncbi:MAG: penicillin-binding transpeptidase domain-containing protein [Thermoanaerobaculia bacterium]
MESPEFLRGLRGRIVIGLAALVVLLIVIYVAAGVPLRSAREAWREERFADAAKSLDRWSRLHLRPAEYDHLNLVVALSEGRSRDAEPLLGRVAERGRSLFPVVRKAEVMESLVNAGRFEETLKYDAAVRQWREGSDVALYRAAGQLGTGRLREAEATLADIDPDGVPAKRMAALRDGLAQRRIGSFPLVFDRSGKAIAAYQIDNRDLVAVNRDFAPLIESTAGPLTIESHLGEIGTSSTIETTLDPVVQRAALQALGGFRGALVAIDVKSNTLLAVASAQGTGQTANIAFNGGIEPGSVVKILTALNLYESGSKTADAFPARCDGLLEIDGQLLYDWAVHGEVPDLDEALAVSCNVTFARIGMKLGAERVDGMLRRAGFGETADLALFSVPLGTHRLAPESDFETATYAVGLQHETTNALHVAMIAAAIGNRGVMTVPRLLRGRRSILGDALGVDPTQRQYRLAAEASVKPVASAMEAAVVNPRGTGRRAVVSGVPVALKTGTAGTAADGYDAIIAAYAPAHDPRIAIGIMAENSGAAEYAGAQMTQTFFTVVAYRLK